MNTCTNYRNPLESAGIFWKEKDGTYKAIERIYLDRYELFIEEKRKYRKYRNEIQLANKKKKEERVSTISKRNSYKEYAKQANLFNQPKPKPAPIIKTKESQLNLIQRVVKSLFNL
jgi:AAA15 family ATPase/GTPase